MKKERDYVAQGGKYVRDFERSIQPDREGHESRHKHKKSGANSKGERDRFDC